MLDRVLREKSWCPPPRARKKRERSAALGWVADLSDTPRRSRDDARPRHSTQQLWKLRAPEEKTEAAKSRWGCRAASSNYVRNPRFRTTALLPRSLSPPLQRKTALETGRAKATYGNTYLLARVFPVNTTESLTAGLKNRIRGPGETLHCIYVPGTSLCTAQARQLTSLRIGVPLPASNTHSREAFARHPAQHAIDGSGCTAPSAGAASHGSSARHARALRVD